MNKEDCDHRELVLALPQGRKLRCRHCHLTIDEKELGRDGFCPECYGERGEKRRDFEEVMEEQKGKLRYVCERCGAII